MNAHIQAGDIMNGQDSQSVSCCSSTLALVGGLEAREFGTLDQLAVKLICLDKRFEISLREMGRLIGHRIAEGYEKPIRFETALSSLVSACGLEGVVDSAFLRIADDGALLQITGCATILGWQIPNLDRAVCSFDAGLFEGFLCGATREEAWGVQEISCLGLDQPACEFLIQRMVSYE